MINSFLLIAVSQYLVVYPEIGYPTINRQYATMCEVTTSQQPQNKGAFIELFCTQKMQPQAIN